MTLKMSSTMVAWMDGERIQYNVNKLLRRLIDFHFANYKIHFIPNRY